MLIQVTDDQAIAVLGALRGVAAAGGIESLTAADRRALDAFDRLVLRREPVGELLVSTFTAGMHPREPMSGHILPVIISWHLGIELLRFAGSTSGQLDPEKFWFAWERGAETTTDVFSDRWNFWTVAAEPLEDLRAAYRVPPLDPAHAADGRVPGWYHPVA